MPKTWKVTELILRTRGLGQRHSLVLFKNYLRKCWDDQSIERKWIITIIDNRLTYQNRIFARLSFMKRGHDVISQLDTNCLTERVHSERHFGKRRLFTLPLTLTSVEVFISGSSSWVVRICYLIWKLNIFDYLLEWMIFYTDQQST